MKSQSLIQFELHQGDVILDRPLTQGLQPQHFILGGNLQQFVLDVLHLTVIG